MQRGLHCSWRQSTNSICPAQSNMVYFHLFDFLGLKELGPNRLTLISRRSSFVAGCILASLGKGLLDGDTESTGNVPLTVWKVQNADFIALQGAGCIHAVVHTFFRI